jgi:nucleoid-associated protein
MDFVIHELLKDPNGPVRERYRESLIPPTEEETSFVSEVTRLFGRHQSGRIYGNFESDTIAYPFSQVLATCQGNGDFLKFSTDAAKLLTSKMKAIPAATGGYFFASQFDQDNETLLLIFMLSQRQSHAVDEKTLSLRRSRNLQMEHLDLAARISISDWQDGKPEPVSLIRGRKEVSEYFKNFIGLHEPRTNTQGTQKLKDFVEKWMDTYEFSTPKKEAVRESVLGYAKERRDQPVELDVVASFVDPERHQQFFYEANEVGLGAEFHIDRRSLSSWVRVVYSDGDVKVNFARRLLNKRVSYNREQRRLLIREIDLPEEDLL